MIERRVAYNPAFDKRDFNSLNSESTKDLERFSKFIDKQIDTHIGERFNVLLSNITYEITEGKIYSEDSKTPFIQIMQNGVVSEREKAEIEGFEKIENFFSNYAEDGDMMISISPPAEEYTHNFYDIFTLRENDGKKQLEMRRYSSALSIPEYTAKLAPLKSYESEPTDEDFLRDPIKVDRDLFDTPNEVHKYLHKEHGYVTVEQFEKIRKSYSSLKKSYIESLSEKNSFDQLITLNAIYNMADIAWEAEKNGNFQEIEINLSFNPPSKKDILFLGMQPVRVVQTPCGSSGGFSFGGAEGAMNTPFRVFDKQASIRSQNKEWFNCPKCKFKADGPVGNQCPGCGLTKEQYVSQGGAKCD